MRVVDTPETGEEEAGETGGVLGVDEGVDTLESGEEEAGEAGVVPGVDAGVDEPWTSETGQIVVLTAITDVTVVIEFAGQFVTVGAQLVTTISVVLKIVEVVMATPVSVVPPSETDRLPPEAGEVTMAELEALTAVPILEEPADVAAAEVAADKPEPTELEASELEVTVLVAVALADVEVTV